MRQNIRVRDLAETWWSVVFVIWVLFTAGIVAVASAEHKQKLMWQKLALEQHVQVMQTRQSIKTLSDRYNWLLRQYTNIQMLWPHENRKRLDD